MHNEVGQTCEIMQSKKAHQFASMPGKKSAGMGMQSLGQLYGVQGLAYESDLHICSVPFGVARSSNLH